MFSMKSIGRGLRAAGQGIKIAGQGAGNLWDDVSGASATKRALNQQMQGVQQAQGSIGDAYKQGQGLLAPYQQSGEQNLQSLQSGIDSGAFSPQYQQFQGQASAGNQFMPQYQQFQGPQQFQPGQYNAPESFQGSNATTDNLGAYSLQGFNPSMPNEPQRQAATAENVNMYQDPGYQFRLNQGIDAVQNSAAARGLLGSSATLNNINEYAQGLASQEFGNAYNRFQDNQNNARSDFMDNRNFAAGQLNDAYSRFSGDRGFGRGVYQDDRNFGRDVFTQDRGFGQSSFQDARNFGYGMNQDQNAWNAQNADRGYSQFSGDRNFGYGMNQDQNAWNANTAMNNYNMRNNMVNRGYDASSQGANMATDYGRSMADLYTGAGNARGAATLAQSNQRRGLFGDIVDTGFRAAGAYQGGR